MLCECGFIEKKRTLLDGIKCLSGDLAVYRIGGEEGQTHHINRCCFLTIVPSLYTFVDISWLTDADIIVVNTAGDAQVRPVFRVKAAMIDRLRSLGGDQLRIQYDDSSRLVTPDYIRIFGDLNEARRRNFEVERDFKQITYKYAAIEHDNKLLRKQSTHELCDSEETTSTSCDHCKSIGTLRKSLKEQRLKIHEQINVLQYALDTERAESAKLRMENERLKDSNAKLAEANLSLYMNQ